MSILRVMLLLILTTPYILSCSVISQQVREESVKSVHFKTLVMEADKHIGDIVILGGYILETKNSVEEAKIVVLQSPLGFREEPKSKDYSQGRFLVFQKGFLEPEIYSKDRKITVAGEVIGSVVKKVDDFFHPYLKIKSREIYLWPTGQYDYYTPYYDPWYCPYFNCWPWYRHHPYYW